MKRTYRKPRIDSHFKARRGQTLWELIESVRAVIIRVVRGLEWTAKAPSQKRRD